MDATLDRLCGDEDLLLEILDMFLVEFAAEQANIQHRIQHEDFSWLASKAHYFKGMSQNLGLLGFSIQIRQFEQLAKQGDQPACAQCMFNLTESVQRIQALRDSLR